MRRVLLAAGVVVGLGTLISAAPSPPPAPPHAPPSAVAVPHKLGQRVKINGIDDPKATLTEALEMLTKNFDVAFEINERAFKFENIMDVGKTEIASLPIPAMKNVRLSSVLRKILSRIPSPSGATFCVRADHIEITTGVFQAAEVWGKYVGPRLPLVNATLEKCPLEDAVKELADQSDFNVVLDNRAGEKAKTPVTARLLNMPLDTALRLLADMAELRAVHLDNVLYVTSKENATALETRLEKEKGPDDGSPLSQPRKGTGPGNLNISQNDGGA